MAGEMGSILRELEKVQDRLGTLPKSALHEKNALLSRQEELRTQAARLADGVDARCSTQDLLAQLAGLRRQRDALARQRTHPGRQSIGGPKAGPTGSSHLTRIEERMDRIRQVLADRGIKLR